MEDYSLPPDPETCPICGRSFGYAWDGEEWVLETCWWFLPGQYDFLCGKICYRKALKEGYYGG